MLGDFRVGGWLVQPRINSLERDGTVQHLEPKVMQVLVFLASEPGDVVTRDRIRSAVWPDVFVGEDVLIRAISEIRRAFGDDARSPHTVQTIPKAGYRLIAPVERDLPQEESDPLPTPAPPIAPSGNPEIGAVTKPLFRARTSAALAVFGLLLATVGYLLLRDRPGKPTQVTIRPLTTYPGQELQPAFSPDGHSVAFVWRKPNENEGHIYIKATSSEGPVRLLTGDDAEYSPAWSPDGRSLALIRQNATASIVETVSATGSEERQLYRLPVRSVWEYAGLTWTADGQNLIFPQHLTASGSSQLVELSLASHALRNLTNPPAGWDGDWMPSVSPDGHLLSFTRGSERSARDLFIMALPDGKLHRLTSDNRLIVGTSWTPDNSAIVFASNRGGSMALWRVPAEGGTPEHEAVGTEDAYGPTLAQHGNKLAYSRGNAEWSIIQANLSESVPSRSELLNSTQQDSAPALSPDGKRLAFQSWRSGGQEIWVADADGRSPVQLTQTGNFSGSPAWSPSGDQLAYDTRIGGFARLCTMGAHGEGARTLSNGDYDDIVPSWSADGAWLYFGSNRSGSWQVWRTAADGSGKTQQISINGGMVARESPDGLWVYYTRRGLSGLWRRSVSGGPELQTADGPADGFQDYWTVTAQGIFLLTFQDGSYVLNRMDPRTKRSEVVYTYKHIPSPFAGVTVTANGDRLVLTELTRAESNITVVDGFR